MTTLHLRNSIRSFLIPVALAVFALSPTVQALLPGPTPDGGYDGGNTAEGNGALFSVVISPPPLPGSITPPLVITRSIATPTATPTRRLVLMHSLATQPASTTRPPVIKRSFPTRLPSAIQPMVFERSLPAMMAATIRPTALMRSNSTQAATRTWPMVRERS
jgi:hypothetical protein